MSLASAGACAVLTPICDNGFDALKLGSALGRLCELQFLELCWGNARHGYEFAIYGVEGANGGRLNETLGTCRPARMRSSVIGASCSTPGLPASQLWPPCRLVMASCYK
jgi:hypothetical protein